MLVRAYVGLTPRLRGSGAQPTLPVRARVSLLLANGRVISAGTTGVLRARPGGAPQAQRQQLEQTVNLIVPARAVTADIVGIRARLMPARGWRECARCGGARDTYNLTQMRFEQVLPSLDANGGPSETLPLDVYFLSWPATPASATAVRAATLATIRQNIQGAYPLADNAANPIDRTAGQVDGFALDAAPANVNGVFSCADILRLFQDRIRRTVDGTVPGWQNTADVPTRRGQAPAAVMPRYIGLVGPGVGLDCGGLAPAPGRVQIARVEAVAHELGHNLSLDHAGDFHGEDGPGVGAAPNTFPFEPFPDVRPRFPNGAGRLSNIAYTTSLRQVIPFNERTPLRRLQAQTYNPRNCAQEPVPDPIRAPAEGCDYDFMSYGTPRTGYMSPIHWNAAVDLLALYRTCHAPTPTCQTAPQP